MKRFRIAREGKTIDNREITGEQIEQMAANYNPKIYGARIWLEHFRGMFADSPFKALGDVVSLSSETDETGRKVLLAELDPTADLVQMNQNRQKIFTSIELDPSFSDTGEAYLVGLGVTDNPASTGTEALKFNVSHDRVGNCFSDFNESNIDLNAKPEQQPNETDKGLLDKVKALFSKSEAKIEAQSDEVKAIFADMSEALTFAATELQNKLSEKEAAFAAQTDKLAADLTAKFEQLHDDFSELKKQLDSTPDNDFTPRPPAEGGSGEILTDC